MTNFELPLFPYDSVAVSVTTTVWVGVCVVAFFNLRLGWTMSGLVVPGYLVPLLIVKPQAATVIVWEAVMTYLIVGLLSRWLFPRIGWCGFFGRDRFLFIVVASVAVRVAADGWLLPWLGAMLNTRFGMNLDYHNDLHSYGLVMVALMANYFWKPGLVRGSLPMAVTVGCTYAIIQFGLVRLTNFNVGNLHSMYEGIAASLLASPKAYMILILGAYIASSMNLGYGWEFNGILVPAMLALHWHEPWKIFITFAEAGLILSLTSLLLKLPMWQRTTVEGARKVIIFFSVCFLYRLALNHLMPVWFPHYRVTDFYGFGYLLSTLLAIKAYQHERVIQLVRNTLQASMMGAVSGTLVGFLFTLLPVRSTEPISATIENAQLVRMSSSKSLSELLQEHKLSLYRRIQPNSVRSASRQELVRFGQAIEKLRDYAETRNDSSLSAAQSLLNEIQYACTRVEDRYCYLHELPPGRGWGAFVLDLRKPPGLVVEVPAPREEPGTIEAALSLFRLNHGSALAIAGSGRSSGHDGSADVVAHQATLFGVFHRQMDRANIIQIRGYTRTSLRRLTGTRQADADSANESWTSSLWINNAIPAGLNLQLLKDLMGHYEIHWQPTPTANILRDNTRSGFAELVLNRADRRRLRGLEGRRRADISTVNPAAGLAPDSSDGSSCLLVESGTPYPWLLAAKDRIAARGTNAYVPCTVEELIYLDEEVFRPIIRVVSATESWRQTGKEQIEELTSAAESAGAVGYQVTIFTGDDGVPDHLVIHEREPRTRNWGAVVLRWSLRQPFVIEVPRPIFERNAFEFAVDLFRRSESSAFLMAGADPRANSDGTADIARTSNRVNLINLARHALLRERGDQSQLVVQTRAIRAPVSCDALLAVDQGFTTRAELTSLKESLVARLERDGLTLEFTNGSPLTAGYEASAILLESVTAPHENKELAVVWLSPSLRSQYTQQIDNDLSDDMFATVGIPTVRASLQEHLSQPRDRLPDPPLPITDAIRQAIVGFLRNHDIVQLRRLVLEAADWSLTRLVDGNSGYAFLILATRSGDVVMIAKLSAVNTESPLTIHETDLARERIEEFIDSRATFLEVRPQP